MQQLFHRLIDTENAIFSFREGMQVALAYHVNQNIPKLLLESARVQDELSNNGTLKAIVGEMAGSSEQATHVPEDWDTWNKEMLTELQRMVLPDEEATLKRFYHEGDRVRLQPANASMKPIVVD